MRSIDLTKRISKTNKWWCGVTYIFGEYWVYVAHSATSKQGSEVVEGTTVEIKRDDEPIIVTFAQPGQSLHIAVLLLVGWLVNRVSPHETTSTLAESDGKTDARPLVERKHN